MKKFLAILLVVMMSVSCFAGCKTENTGKPELGGTLDQLTSVLGDIDAIQEDITASMTITMNQPLFSDESLSALMGEEGAVALPVLKPFIKNDTTIEIPFSMSFAGKVNGAGKFDFKFGNGAEALAFSGIFADGDMFLNIKEIYAWAAVLVNTITGESYPEWPLENEYVSLMDILAIAQGSESGDVATFALASGTSSDTVIEGGSFYEENIYSGSPVESLLSGLGGMNGITPEMITAFAEAVVEAVPEQSITDLLNIIETTITNAGMISEENGYTMITIDGDSLKKLPDAFANAAKGKLGNIIDSVVNGIRNSDNSILASLIPADAEINGSEIEALLIEEIKAVKGDLEVVATEMDAMNMVMKCGFKVVDNGIDCKFSAQCTIEEDGISATIKFDVAANMKAIDELTVQAPSNVLTETELSEFLAGFMAGLG